MAETGEIKPPAPKPDPETTSPPPQPLQPEPPSQPEQQKPLQPQPQSPPTPPPQPQPQPQPQVQQTQTEVFPPKRPQQLESSPNPTTPSDTKDVTPTTISSRLTEPDFVYIPSYSRWFSWNNIHECEVRFLSEFFDARSPSKNPKTYKYYRNSIIRRFRDNPTRKITCTEARKTIVGDVGSIRRVFDFLETWGLINYTANSSKSLIKWEEKESKSTSASAPQNADANGTSTDLTVPKKRQCNACKTVCRIACFTSDKYDLTLCARCYVSGDNGLVGNTSDFRRVEISEEVKTDWTDKETLRLLEALMHYGDDWAKVAEHVGGRSTKECVARFVKLPFGEQFMGPPESAEVDSEPRSETMNLQSKRMRLTPLADASNPIMAQAAFLSALAGKEVAELSAHAAVTALSEIGEGITKGSLGSVFGGAERQDYAELDGTSNGYDKDKLERFLVEARPQLEKEALDLERAVSDVAIETKEIEDRIARFEERDLQMEKEWRQLMQLKSLIFIDQLTLLLNKAGAPKAGETIGEEG